LATIRVNIESVTGGKKHIASVPDDLPINRLLPALIRKLGLPANDDTGRRVSYRLLHRESGTQLNDNDTLVTSGVKPEDTLKILAEVIAG
jgi:hypothetical protein